MEDRGRKVIVMNVNTFVDFFNPNKKLSVSSCVWYILALLLVVAAVAICFCESWQNGGEVIPIYKGGVFAGTRTVRAPVLLEICPDMLTIIWALVIYTGFVVKKYVQFPSNIWTVVMALCDVLLLASLIRSFLPADSVELFCFLGIKSLAVTVKPQWLLVGVILFSWLSMRSISGFGLIILFVAFVSRMNQLNLDMGLYGVVYVLCGFFSLLIQSFLPTIGPEEGYRRMFLSDVGRTAGNVIEEAKRDLAASVETIEKGVSGVATLAGTSMAFRQSPQVTHR